MGGDARRGRQCGHYAAGDWPLGLDTKNKTLYAQEQDQERRAEWREYVQAFAPATFIFVAAISTTTNMARRYARAPHDQRAYSQVPRHYGSRPTLIASLMPDGMGPAMTLEGAGNTAAFTASIEQVVCPTLRPGLVVLMDNRSSPLSPRVQAAIEAVHCALLLLPPYSPAFSPMERAFSKCTEGLRAAAARVQEALEAAIATALDDITSADAMGWFKPCGYQLPSSS